MTHDEELLPAAEVYRDLHAPGNPIRPKLTERNLERFEALAADKGYDDQAHRDRLRAWGKRPSRKHREKVVAVCLVYNLERAVKLGVSLLDRLWARLLYSLQ